MEKFKWNSKDEIQFFRSAGTARSKTSRKSGKVGDELSIASNLESASSDSGVRYKFASRLVYVNCSHLNYRNLIWTKLLARE